MIPKKLEETDEAAIEDLLANAVAEGKTIEYKLRLPGGSDLEKKEFLADVSSFANTSGGDLIFGIEEDKGIPVGIPGLEIADPDFEVRRLDSIINDGLDPRARFSIRVVQRTSSPPVLIIRVERSWIGPHRVEKGYEKFYARSSAGKYSMDVAQLRAAFTLASAVSEKVQHFRADRIAKLMDDRTPVPFVRGAKTVLHLIPLESLAGPVQYDVVRLYRERHRFPPMHRGSSWSARINLDGVVTFNGAPGAPYNSTSYTQVFRNGVLEAVEGTMLNRPYQGKRTIPDLSFEQELVEQFAVLRGIHKELGIIPPVAIALTLTDTKGLEIHSNLGLSQPITEDHLILPESLIEDYAQPAGMILKPVLDLIWNACGYERSRNLDDDGNFRRS